MEVSAEIAGRYGDIVERVVRDLSRDRRHRDLEEEAVADAVVRLLEDRPEVFTWPAEDFGRYLNRAAQRSMVKALGLLREHPVMALGLGADVAGRGQPVVAHTQSANEEARLVPPPPPGKSWAPEQMLGAVQRFRDEHGRPPLSSEAGRSAGLPDKNMAGREFGGWNAMVRAAGMTPLATEPRPKWPPFEAARECLSFRRRNGYWPHAGDAAFLGSGLPGREVMKRIFGGIREDDVRRGVESILGTAT